MQQQMVVEWGKLEMNRLNKNVNRLMQMKCSQRRFIVDTCVLENFTLKNE